MSERTTTYRTYVECLRDDADINLDNPVYDSLTQGLAHYTCPASLPGELRALSNVLAIAIADLPPGLPRSRVTQAAVQLLALAGEVRQV